MSTQYHFDDCPYHCNEQGKILDPVSKQMVNCPHCSDKRREAVRDQYSSEDNLSVDAMLGLRTNYRSDKLIYDDIIPEAERLFISDESMAYQQMVVEDIYNGLIIGEVPKSSYCFGIGIKGRLDRLIYPMMLKAYKAGIRIARFCTAARFSRYLIQQSEILDDYYDADLAFIVINSSCILQDMYNIKGLMEERGLAGKPTILATTWKPEACSGILWYLDRSNKENEDILIMAKPVFIGYTHKEKKKDFAPNKYTRAILNQDDEYEDEYGRSHKLGDNSKHIVNGNIGVDNDILKSEYVERFDPELDSIGVSLSDL